MNAMRPVSASSTVPIVLPSVREALYSCIDEATSGQQLHTAYQHDDWTLLQFAASTGDLVAVKTILASGVDPNGVGVRQNSVNPQMAPLHIASRCNHVEIMKELMVHCNVNARDQWGFTPIHYAVISRHREALLCLLEYGGSASAESENKSTPLDIARALGFEEIADILASKISRDQDPFVPKFRDWLHHLDAGEYIAGFIRAGLTILQITIDM